ncbi:MAG TPA: heparan-alpha-glucosaminide N-acetyltransferase domain-containing protein, partial [Bacteroidia bacterium]|nr:heparan-alpha-glucosaminide N-acetyltransferase domain-containing protein [Bacteroidia bacterium]
FCAPTFIFLTGLSAYLYGSKHNRNQLSRFLLTRGLWLIFLEVTLFAFGWFMKINLTHPVLMVIWAIGISMVFLALVSRLPYTVILIFGVVMVFLHNAGDHLQFAQGSVADIAWRILHVQGPVTLGPGFRLMILYPILPYLGLICLGYALGKLYTPETNTVVRKKMLLWIGLSAIALFILIRLTNLYGDLYPWEHQDSLGYTILSFINCTKYPVSLLFALMTLGPAILFLWLMDGVHNAFVNFLVVIGKVPMFYYILHLYLIRCLALMTERQGTTPMGMHGVYHLGTVYLIWAGVIVALYYPCKWYGRYKSAHPEQWLLGYL